MTQALGVGFQWVLTAMVMSAALPLCAACYQFALIGLHGLRNHYRVVGDGLREQGEPTPRVAVLVPAWNEEAVIANTIERLLALDYPTDSLRVCVIDDASTDQTPQRIAEVAQANPGRVVSYRRDRGGEGKAEALNHGIRMLFADDWCEALLIIDSDVVFEPRALRLMTRHFADPGVGSVTAYIKEGSRPANYMRRFIAFEYITAQAAARRSQNVLGALACLAGGAQLHRRPALEAIGGRIDSTSLAEDTFTTILIQQAGYRVLFEGNAIVWAEEPGDIAGLWKQRLRWARGNLQVTKRFRGLWFRGKRSSPIGSFSFGLFWFTIMLMPVFMISASVALVTLYFTDFAYAWEVFRALWLINAVTYLFITLFSFSIDTQTARRAWFEGLMFPGLIAVVLIAYSCFPPLFEVWGREGLLSLGIHGTGMIGKVGILFAYVWLSASMVFAWLARLLEGARISRWLSAPLVYLVGYGPLLCAITFTSYVKQARGAETTWDKTVKTGKVFG